MPYALCPVPCAYDRCPLPEIPNRQGACLRATPHRQAKVANIGAMVPSPRPQNLNSPSGHFPILRLRKKRFSLAVQVLFRISVIFSFALVVLVPAAQAAYLDLAWDAPTTNIDETPLTDLAGYRVYYGSPGVTCYESPFQEVPSPTAAPAAGDSVTFRLGGLVSGATYSVRVSAVNTNGIESDCSNEATGVAKDEVASSGGGGGGGVSCFIATAAFGSALDPRVALLRSFRDRYLMTSAAGRAFVLRYYRLSPPLAEKIRQSPFLKFLVRAILWPLVAAAWLILHPSVIFGLALISACAIGFRRRRQRTKR
jgi:hypothetical protein